MSFEIHFIGEKSILVKRRLEREKIKNRQNYNLLLVFDIGAKALKIIVFFLLTVVGNESLYCPFF